MSDIAQDDKRCDGLYFNYFDTGVSKYCINRRRLKIFGVHLNSPLTLATRADLSLETILRQTSLVVVTTRSNSS